DLLHPVLDLPVKMRKGSSIMGIEATVAALEHGQEWLAEVKTVLRGNRDRVVQFFADQWPDIPLTSPEATYLAWFDLSGFSFSSSTTDHFVKNGRVALSDGCEFGTVGAGWLRLNFGTTPAILDEILDRVGAALKVAHVPGRSSTS